MVISISRIKNIEKENLLAKQYWKSEESQKIFYESPSHYSEVISEIAKYTEAKRVFEFGCAAGRNLNVIKNNIKNDTGEDIFVHGIDINKNHVEQGAKLLKLDLLCRDENYINTLEPNSFDLVFTVSVLDHVVNAKEIIQKLMDLTSQYCVFIEPFKTGVNAKFGKIEAINTLWSNSSDHEPNPYTYIHDYPMIFKDAGYQLVQRLPMPTHLNRAGPIYNIWIVSKQNCTNPEEIIKLRDKVISVAMLALLRNNGIDRSNAKLSKKTLAESEKKLADSERKLAESERRLAESERKLAGKEQLVVSLQDKLDNIQHKLNGLRSSIKYRFGLAISNRTKHPLQFLMLPIDFFELLREWRATKLNVNQEMELASFIAKYGSSNTGVSIENYLRQFIKFIDDNTVDLTIKFFREDAPEKAFELMHKSLLNDSRLGKNAKIYLKRTETILRINRHEYKIPQKRNALIYEPNKLRTFYLLHMRSPAIINGYSVRSDFILQALKASGYQPTGITRLGFPKDVNKIKNAKFKSIEVVNGTSFFSLLDSEKGLRGRPIDDLISTYASRIVDLALNQKPFVIHAASNYINGLAAVIAARQLGIPSVYEVRGLWHLTSASRHTNYEQTEKYKFEQKMELLAVKNADRVICISDGLRQYFLELGVEKEKLHIVPNGIDTQKFLPISRNKKLAKNLHLPEDTVVIGYIGSLIDYEGLDILINAVSIMRSEGINNFKLLVIGQGQVYEALIAQSKMLDLSDICMFTGAIPKEDVPSYYSLIDIAPFPRKNLPVTRLVPPLKPMEAMAMGIPIVVSDLPALVELGINGEGAIHFKAGNAVDLANELSKLIRSKKLREKIGSAGLEWIKQERSLSKTCQKLSKVFDFEEAIIKNDECK